jgi:hypothetical protein
MKSFARIATALTVLLALAGIASAQTWAPLAHQPTAVVGAMLQLRDGRILVRQEQGTASRNWFVFTPDAQGSYANGTWSSAGQLPSGYTPWYFGSQVMMDGKTVVIEGGEYNGGTAVWTTLGARLTYSGSSFTWVSNAPPAGWTTIGDAQSSLLANGKYMQANCCTPQNAIYTGPNTWIPAGSVKAIRNDESAWTALPNGKLLAVDVQVNNNCGGSTRSSELYDPTTDTWSCGPQTPVQLWLQADQELGASVLMYNNKVFQIGGAVSATAVYDVASNTWSAGPTPANNLDQADGPAALEPNGKVLAELSPGLFQAGCQMVEYDPSSNTLANTANPQRCPADSSYVGHLMILPTGQIMFTDFRTRVELYTPAPGVVAAAVPTILGSSTNLKIGSVNNVLYGKQLNGLTENNGYGDDYQAATNYPLVKLVSTSTGNVYWALTHDESTHSIAPGTIMYTKFDIPATVPAGTYKLISVANGISSNAVVVSVQ